MAQSPAHELGQIIGNRLQSAVEPMLRQFAEQNGLYLDRAGARRARAGKKKPCWTDHNGNKHDLDYVLERNGSDSEVGVPVGFVEVAWRRYTKHSRNKAQEIQGALAPLAETYRHVGPFKGVVLAGEFTQGAIKQLRSLGFSVVHLSYNDVLSSFAKVGVDVSTSENTSETELAKKVKAAKALTSAQEAIVEQELSLSGGNQFEVFIQTMKHAVSRTVERVRVLPLYGHVTDFTSIDEAVLYLTDIDVHTDDASLVRFEVEIYFSNKAHIRGEFPDKGAAIDFLNSHFITTA